MCKKIDKFIIDLYNFNFSKNILNVKINIMCQPKTDRSSFHLIFRYLFYKLSELTEERICFGGEFL